MSYIHALFVGKPKSIRDEKGTWTSSIFRDPVDKVMAKVGGLVGDKVTQSYHGGEDADICLHLLEHYQFWNEHYDMNLKAGYVGENITLVGVDEKDVCVGDVVRLGEAIIQVSGRGFLAPI
ncbi:MAG: MOSC domain-containing protein [Deinococcales bacterium]